MNIIGPGDIPDRTQGPLTPKSAKLGDLEIEITTGKQGKVTPPKDVIAQHPVAEEISVISPAQSNLPKAAELIKKQLTGNGARQQNALKMAESLDRYVEKGYARQVAHEMKHAFSAAKKAGKLLTPDEKQAVAQQVEAKIYKKFNDSLLFFVTIDLRKGQEVPLERMSAPFDYLTRPEDPSLQHAFYQGIAEYAAELAVRAFDQHLDNPEQYVSHGFDHSINVANYTRDVLAMNPEIYQAAAAKYKITEGEAKFMLETVSLLHDCGYPCVGHKAKSVHGISGADIILPMREMFNRFITSPEAKKEELFNDFRNSILFHSADKIEYAFSSKIVSTLGTFLADQDNIVQVLSNFYDPSKNPSGQARFVTEIYVQNPQRKREIEEALSAARQDFENKAGRAIELPKVIIHDGLFKGRFADLESNKDKKLGLEFSTTDLLSHPLTMIRLVDNMDMRKTRFTPTQNEEAFRRIYYELGNNQKISQLAIAFESLERKIDDLLKTGEMRDKLADDIARTTQEVATDQINILQPGANPFVTKVLNRLAPMVATLKGPQGARDLLNRALIETIFEEDEFRALPLELKEQIRQIGMFQSSIDLRHFGGCEAVMDVQLKGIPLSSGKTLPIVTVTVNEALFHDLNAIRVTESSPSLTGVRQSITVGVGEYQIWRASDAYRSILLGGDTVRLMILNEQGRPVNSTILGDNK